jgi:hypothetical protein
VRPSAVRAVSTAALRTKSSPRWAIRRAGSLAPMGNGQSLPSTQLVLAEDGRGQVDHRRVVGKAVSVETAHGKARRLSERRNSGTTGVNAALPPTDNSREQTSAVRENDAQGGISGKRDADSWHVSWIATPIVSTYAPFHAR